MRLRFRLKKKQGDDEKNDRPEKDVLVLLEKRGRPVCVNHRPFRRIGQRKPVADQRFVIERRNAPRKIKRNIPRLTTGQHPGNGFDQLFIERFLTVNETADDTVGNP